jgi:hypothetical protein
LYIDNLEVCIHRGNTYLDHHYHGYSRAALFAVVHLIYMSCYHFLGW